ncbi:MAG: ABC transporter ATP-binding protein [Gemmatimonadota bacterium]
MRPSGGEILIGLDLGFEVGDRTVLAVPRVTLREGEILAILGPNGSGKTTLLHVLAGLRRPTSGRIEYRGHTGADARKALRLSTAAVFQRPHLWEGSVRMNLELGLRIRGRRRPSSDEMAARVEARARQLGVAALLDAPARHLSGGEMQRVAIARALLLEPDVLFLDEPTANLDLEVCRSLREDVERVARQGTSSVLLATHDRVEAFSLADRVAVLREGRIVQQGTPTDLYEDPQDPMIARFTGAELTLEGRIVAGRDGFVEVEAGSTRLTARGEAPVGANVKIAYRPEDLLLVKEVSEHGSARNRLTARIKDVRLLGGVMRVRLAAPVEMVAVVTRAAAEELELREGGTIGVLCKATALHVFQV